MPRLVAGIDSSTQQTKLVVLDHATGELVHSSALPHPDGTELDPRHWWAALEGTGAADPANVAAMSITAQQHSTIFLDEEGESVRPSLLWNDVRASAAAAALRQELGDDTWLRGVGLLPDGAHPVSKIRWIAEHEPAHAARLATVLLPHDWLTWSALARRGTPSTDRSDASATGYWSPFTQEYRPDLIIQALGRPLRTPEVKAPQEVAGVTPGGVLVAAGCGDNGASHLALDTSEGDIVISVGTSTTVSVRTADPFRDSSGSVDTMADPRSGFIPIVAMLNGARALSATARMLGISLDRLDTLAQEAPPDADGAIMIPFLDGERNPVADAASGALLGLSRHTMTPATIARAAVLGLACAITAAVETLPSPMRGRIFLIGGGARAASLRQAVADMLGRQILWPTHREHAAYGAARQAAWALTGTLPDWPMLRTESVHPREQCAWVAAVRERYAAAIR